MCKRGSPWVKAGVGEGVVHVAVTWTCLWKGTAATAAEFKQVEGKLNSNCYCSGSKAQGRKHSPFV